MKNKKRIFTYAAVICFFLTGILFATVQERKAKSPGELSKVHGALTGPDNCAKCHSQAKKVEPANCLGCHTELAQRIKAGKGYHRDKKEDCADCHSEHNGKDHRLAEWDPADFDHSETGYALAGAHGKIKNCHRCHHTKNSPPRKVSKTFLLNDKRCSACHRDAHRGNQPVCTDCHTTSDWSVDIW